MGTGRTLATRPSTWGEAAAEPETPATASRMIAAEYAIRIAIFALLSVQGTASPPRPMRGIIARSHGSCPRRAAPSGDRVGTSTGLSNRGNLSQADRILLQAERARSC